MTFVLVSFAWLFFRAGGIRSAVFLLQNMIRDIDLTILVDGSMFGLGIEREYFYILLFSIVILFYVDYRKYKGNDVAELLLKQGWWFRTLVEMLLLFGIMLFGCYGEMYDAQEFIYFQF